MVRRDSAGSPGNSETTPPRPPETGRMSWNPASLDDLTSRQLDERMHLLILRKSDGQEVLAIKSILEKRYNSGLQHAPGCFCDDCADADRRCVAPSGAVS